MTLTQSSAANMLTFDKENISVFHIYWYFLSFTTESLETFSYYSIKKI